jgi:HlyD family secretion protein
VVVAAAIGWKQMGEHHAVSAAAPAKTLRVAENSIETATVRQGTFEDYITIRGHVEPLKTIYLDAVEGGRVEKILVEDGATVQAGQLLVVLSNPTLQLDIISREAAVSTQLTQVRNTELSFDQDRLTRAFNLTEIEFRLKRLRRQSARMKELMGQGAIKADEVDEVAEELEYQEARYKLEKSTQERRESILREQIRGLKETADTLAKNLDLARSSLQQLEIRAPAAGQITNLKVELGQNLVRGVRVAQLDIPGAYKIRAAVDEFYVQRVHLEQHARMQVAQESFDLKVSKIDPQVFGGKFNIDLVFVAPDGEPANLKTNGLKRGQSLELRLYEGDDAAGTTGKDALLVKQGAFYLDTGGHWAFVVASDGRTAIRKSIRLGRRNSRDIEVLGDLEAGDRIVTSSYASFLDVTNLEISSN